MCDPSNHPKPDANAFLATSFTGNADGILYFAVNSRARPAQVNAKIHGSSFTGNSGYGVR